MGTRKRGIRCSKRQKWVGLSNMKQQKLVRSSKG